MHKFEKLEVWQLAIEYADLCYAIAELLPKREDYNLGSLIETVACQHLIYRRRYLDDLSPLREAYRASHKLAAKLQAMRRALLGERKLREEEKQYSSDPDTPFDDYPQGEK